MESTCAVCGMNAVGYKCEACDEEMSEQMVEHACGVEHVLPKCSGCNQAESKCSC